MKLEQLKSVARSYASDVIFESAGVLRQLLIDSPSIVSVVNRDRRVRIVFRVLDSGLRSFWQSVPSNQRPTLEMVGDGFDPSINPQGSTTELNIAIFVKIEIGMADGTPVTLGDLIHYVANNAGAVYYDPRRSAKTPGISILQKYSQSNMHFAGLPFGYRSLLPAARVTFKALEPLRDRIVG